MSRLRALYNDCLEIKHETSQTNEQIALQVMAMDQDWERNLKQPKSQRISWEDFKLNYHPELIKLV